MPFFSKFPKLVYKDHLVIDITRAIKVKNFVKNNISLFEPYRVKDGETPESLAYDFYGDAEKHWIILATNNIIDPFFDWVMADNLIAKYVTKKYGVGNENLEHHSELDGLIVESGTPSSNIITNLEYETQKNEEKRVIKVVKRQYVEKIENEFISKIKV